MSVPEFLTWLQRQRAKQGVSTHRMARFSQHTLTRSELDRIIRDGHSNIRLDILMRLTELLGARMHVEVPEDVNWKPFRSSRRRGSPAPE